MKQISKYMIGFAALAICSCKSETVEPELFVGEGESVISVSFDTDTFIGKDTKSSSVISDDGVNNANIYVFTDGKLLKQYYFEKGESFIFNLKQGKEYSVYALVNVGRVEIGEDENAFPDTRLSFDSFDRVMEYGIPMCSSFSESVICSSAKEVVNIHLDRLVARMDFSIDDSTLMYGTFEVNSIKVKQTPSIVVPYGSSFKAESISEVMDGDKASEKDLDSLSCHEGVTLYLLENNQGELLENNQDPWNKQYDNSLIGDKKDLCTYLEVTGTYRDNSGGLEARHTYRMYLGENETTDFSIRRNCVYSLVLSVSDIGVFRDSWKVSRTDVKDSRTIRFSDSCIEIGALSEAGVQVECYPAGVDYHLEWSEPEFHNAGLKGPELEGNNILISSIEALDRDAMTILTAKTFDGEISALCTLTVKADSRIINGEFSAGWDGIPPKYVAQKGRIKMRNIEEGTDLVTTMSQEGIVRLIEESDSVLVVDCLKEGTVRLGLKRKNNNGISPECTIDIMVSPVYLTLPDDCYVLTLDGTEAYGQINMDAWRMKYDVERDLLDPDLYEELLAPQITVSRITGETSEECLFVTSDSAHVVSWNGDVRKLAATSFRITASPQGDIYDSGDGKITADMLFCNPFEGPCIEESVENQYYLPNRNSSLSFSIPSDLGFGDWRRMQFYLDDNLNLEGSPDSKDMRLNVSVPYTKIKKTYVKPYKLKGGNIPINARVENSYSNESVLVKLAEIDVTVALAVSTALFRDEFSSTYDNNGDFMLIPRIFLPDGETAFWTFDNSAADGVETFLLATPMMVRNPSPTFVAMNGVKTIWSPEIVSSYFPYSKYDLSVYPGVYESVNLSGTISDEYGYGREFPDWYYEIKDGDYSGMGRAWRMINPYMLPSNIQQYVDYYDVPESFIRIYDRVSELDLRNF